ncbi:hypothetical protein GCM10028857_13400 [Salinarchaeum chitinilyticum]
MSDEVPRRRYLRLFGISGLIASAGCVSNSDSGDSDTNDSTGSGGQNQSDSESGSGDVGSDSDGEAGTDTDGGGEDDGSSDGDSTSSDTEAPVIHDFSLSGQEFEPGDTMEIDVEVTDQSEISRVYFRFEHVDDGGAVFDAYRDFSPPVDDGTYTIEYSWPENTPGGTYEATQISSEDSIGNIAGWGEEFPTEKGRIEINADSSDTTGPTIEDFSISADTFEPGESMEIDVEVTDETDIERIYFRFEHDDGGGAVYDAYRDFSPPVSSGTYTIEYQWPENTPGGSYVATWIFARDSIGNQRQWADSFSEEKKTIQIDSENQDTDGPVIHDFTVSNDTFEPGSTMQIDAEVSDESGITRIYFRFEHTDGGGAVFDAYRDFSSPVEDGTYTIEYQWPDDTPTGDYIATWIFAEDSVGNTQGWKEEFSQEKRTVEVI